MSVLYQSTYICLIAQWLQDQELVCFATMHKATHVALRHFRIGFVKVRAHSVQALHYWRPIHLELVNVIPFFFGNFPMTSDLTIDGWTLKPKMWDLYSKFPRTTRITLKNGNIFENNEPIFNPMLQSFTARNVHLPTEMLSIYSHLTRVHLVYSATISIYPLARLPCLTHLTLEHLHILWSLTEPVDLATDPTNWPSVQEIILNYVVDNNMMIYGYSRYFPRSYDFLTDISRHNLTITRKKNLAK